MSGSDLPYHLRQNKTVDRDIFFNLLANLELPNKLTDYSYIGLGGPMLEDFRILHQSLGLTKLESIEKDPATFSRQKFNRPYACINCEKLSTSEYIDNFDRMEPTVFWLDYTQSNWQSQFNDVHSLLSKMDAYDVLKLTLNANPDTLKVEGKSKIEVFFEKAGGVFTSRNIRQNDVNVMPRFAKTLADIIYTVTQSALNLSPDLTFFPLLLFRYIDNRHHMLTITGIVMPYDEGDSSRFVEELGLSQWGELSGDWHDIREIAMPDLTSGERLFLNSMLPNDLENFDYESLPFKFHRRPDKNKQILDNYFKYYRFSPSFQRTTY